MCVTQVRNTGISKSINLNESLLVRRMYQRDDITISQYH